MSDIANDNFIFDLPKNRSSTIKVIGVGGGGSNAVNHMYKQGITGVDFVITNTDAQALNNSPVPNKIQLGQTITEGLGAGANPEVGEQAALESLDEIKAILEGTTKMVFITAGMGGGTGTGAAPVIAGIAKEMGILTVGIVTAPFYFEGKMRLEQAEKGIEELRGNVDSLIVVNNDKLRELYGNLGYKSGFAKADEILTTAAKGIAEVITHHYSTNIDLHDARTVLADSGTAIMGTGKASGENKAQEAVENALDSPLLNDNKITGAKNVLLLIVSGDDEVTIDEIGIINDYIQKEAGNSANIIMGIGEDSSLGEDINVTVVATGFPMEDQVFTGREEEKTFYTLEDEQPVIKKLSPEVSAPISVQKLSVKSNEENIESNEDSEEDAEEIRFYLDENEDEKEDEKEEINSIESEVEEEWEPTMKKEIGQPSLFDFEEKSESNSEINRIDKSFSELDEDSPFSKPIPKDFKKIETEFQQEPDFQEERKEPESIIFTLNDDEELGISDEAKADFEEEKLVEAEEKSIETEEDFNPFDSPISEINHVIEERRARLKHYNFTFNNTLREKSVEEIESVPAYKRKGIEISGREDNFPSDFVVRQNENGDTSIRPNNFLHDNVD